VTDVRVNEFGEAGFDLPSGGWIAYPPKGSTSKSDEEETVSVDPDSEIAELMRERTQAFLDGNGARARAIEGHVRDLRRDERWRRQ
jgi:hypothetical protein